MNEGKCKLKLRRARFKDFLIFHCTVESHDHGMRHPIVRSVRSEDIVVVADVLYKEMVKP